MKIEEDFTKYDDCTVLVAHPSSRSIKMAVILVVSGMIVRRDWLDASNKAGHAIPVDNFMLLGNENSADNVFNSHPASGFLDEFCVCFVGGDGVQWTIDLDFLKFIVKKAGGNLISQRAIRDHAAESVLFFFADEEHATNVKSKKVNDAICFGASKVTIDLFLRAALDQSTACIFAARVSAPAATGPTGAELFSPLSVSSTVSI